MLTYESQNPHDLLSNIKSGSLTKRWQSAYELSNLMSDPNKVPTDDLFNNQMQMMYEKYYVYYPARLLHSEHRFARQH